MKGQSWQGEGQGLPPGSAGLWEAPGFTHQTLLFSVPSLRGEFRSPHRCCGSWRSPCGQTTLGEQGLRCPSWGPGRALPPGGSWGFPLLLPRHLPPPTSLVTRPPPQWLCLRAPLGCSLPPLWPTLCSALEAWWGPGSYLSPLVPSSLTGSSEVWLSGVFPGGWEGPGPGRACSVPSLGRTVLLAGTQGALWPAGGWRSSSTRRTAAWMCSLSTWPLPSAPSRKPPAPALTLRGRVWSVLPCTSPTLLAASKGAARAHPGLTYTTPVRWVTPLPQGQHG